MPEEAQQAPEEAQDTSVDTTAAVDETTPAPESEQDSKPADIDWEQRYNDLRPEFDRKNQLLAAAEGHHGPEAQISALRQLGVEAKMEEEEQEQDNEWVDPDERIDALEQRLAQQEAAEEQASFQQLENEFIESTLDKLEEDNEIKLTPQERGLIRAYGNENRFDNREPDLASGFETVKGIRDIGRDAYVSSKKNAPRAPVGTAGTEKIDLSDPETRQKYLTELAESMEGSEE